ncbi:VOC family protein [Romeria aff. gracilis LEGE 07310]|uniref:VOC family protein n=1 Tax=Vasconcelosia minhoensis LEGE 07310 TaxID=915328 RepID=A0A8J7DRG2_9CYAN|nr:VOC family protein [Romeria gracilis]MBE9078454.1 VOC family protein [Romeria aff. gracilis LEGE 07310]
MRAFCQSALVTLASEQFETIVTFYSQLLGQEPQPYQVQVYAEFQLPGLRLGIFKPKADSAQEFAAASSGGLSLCIEVADLERAIAHLTQLGQPPGPIISASHGQEIYAYDPAGNRLILHQSSSSG